MGGGADGGGGQEEPTHERAFTSKEDHERQRGGFGGGGEEPDYRQAALARRRHPPSRVLLQHVPALCRTTPSTANIPAATRAYGLARGNPQPPKPPPPPQALDLLELLYGEKHWLYVSAMHNLGLMYEEAGDLATARATLERVLALRAAMLGTRHFLYADSLFALAHVLAAWPEPRERDRALGLMKDAVHILEEAGGLGFGV